MASSVTTSPEAGLRQKVKGLIRFVLQGRRRTAEVVALVDTGQTLPYDGIISKAAWETLQQPELELTKGWWEQPKKVESYAREEWWRSE